MDGAGPAFFVVGLYVLIRTWRSGSVVGIFGIRGERAGDHPGLFWMMIVISAMFVVIGAVGTIDWLI